MTRDRGRKRRERAKSERHRQTDRHTRRRVCVQRNTRKAAITNVRQEERRTYNPWKSNCLNTNRYTIRTSEDEIINNAYEREAQEWERHDQQTHTHLPLIGRVQRGVCIYSFSSKEIQCIGRGSGSINAVKPLPPLLQQHKKQQGLERIRNDFHKYIWCVRREEYARERETERGIVWGLNLCRIVEQRW